MKNLFLDASYVIALEIINEQNHQVALSHWTSLNQKIITFVTTSYVFDEIVTFFNSRRLHAKAVEIGNWLLNSSQINLIQVDQTLFSESWKFFQQYDDKLYSLTDCVSFIVMQKLRINEALTFDHHFVQAGFIKLP